RAGPPLRPPEEDGSVDAEAAGELLAPQLELVDRDSACVEALMELGQGGQDGVLVGGLGHRLLLMRLALEAGGSAVGLFQGLGLRPRRSLGAALVVASTIAALGAPGAIAAPKPSCERVLVLSAMPLELNPLYRAATITGSERANDRTFYVGSLAGNQVVLAMT